MRSTAGRLAGAGLDVFADEPNVPEELLSMDNVVVLPHVGSGTVQTRAAMEALTLRNLDSFLETGALVTPVPMPAAASRLDRTANRAVLAITSITLTSCRKRRTPSAVI